MRSAPIPTLLFALALAGCAVVFPVAEVVTRPMDQKGSFEEIQKGYTKNIRFGLYEQALPRVSPDLQPQFKEQIPRFRELRFSDVRTESIEIDTLRTEARAVVVYRGYLLSSPFEREFRVVQNWKRQPPSQQWFVTPDFDGMLSPADAAPAPAAPTSKLDR